MKKISLISSVLIGGITLGILSAPLNASATETNVSKNTSPAITEVESEMADSNSKQVENVQFLNNQQLFDELENQGYELTDIFTEEEIETYKAQDKLRAGQTQWVNNSDGTSTLYLSSAYTKTISALGQGASAVIGSLVGGGLGAGFGAFIGQIGNANVNTDRGIYINFDTNMNYVLYPSGWGYQ